MESKTNIRSGPFTEKEQRRLEEAAGSDVAVCRELIPPNLNLYTVGYGDEGGSVVLAETAEDAVRHFIAKYPKSRESEVRDRIKAHDIYDGLVLSTGADEREF